LVSVTPSGAETLTEITDPVEVERLAALCERDRPGSITSTFRNMLVQLGNEKNPSDLLGDSARIEPTGVGDGLTSSHGGRREDFHV